MSAIPWATVRDAIQKWIVTGSGLSGDHVVWAGQRDADGNPMPRPTGQYVELQLSLFAWNGFSDWRRYEYDSMADTLTLKTEGPRVATLTATCFQGVPTGGTGQPAPSNVMAVLNDAMTAMGLDSVFNALVAAGVGVGAFDAIDVRGGVVNTAKFEARAIITVKLNLASEISEVYPVGQGWIQFVHADGIIATDLEPVHVRVSS
jgi:hypothetical protein